MKRSGSWVAGLFAGLVVAALFVSAACGGSTSNGYKTLKVRNDVASFAFEYRAYYEDMDGPHLIERENQRLTFVRLLAPKKRVPIDNTGLGGLLGGQGQGEMQYVPATMEVVSSDASKNPSHIAAIRIEEILRSWGRWPNYKLLESSTVTVSGVEAQMIVAQVDGIIGMPPLMYQAQVSFDHDGLQWEIKAEAEIGMADTVRADLDHILQTFKIFQ